MRAGGWGAMSSLLRRPGLGPLVGHTTDTSCRIWMRAGDPEDEGASLDSNRRTVGVIGLVAQDAAGAEIIKNAYYFRLRREFDRTGTFCLGADVSLGRHISDRRKRGDPVDEPDPLEPDTEYRAIVGSLTLDDPMRDDETMSDAELRDRLPDIDGVKHDLLKLDRPRSEARFRTFPAAAARSATRLGFLLGSCRYPGLLWKIKEADRIFAPMAEHAGETRFGDPVRFALMVGDQIYADKFNRMIPIGLADTYEEFQERYVTAFRSSNMRRLLRQVPSYMILDDHEIEDNWTQDRMADSSSSRLFNVAIGAYMSYQWSHGPRTWGRMLYYTFDCAGYPFFVLDARTQRFKGGLGLDDNHMLGRPSIDRDHPSQLDRLLAWLGTQQDERGNVPKFIVTSSVFVPNDIGERSEAGAGTEQHVADSDAWPSFPTTRRTLLGFITERRIQNVVFLSGDIHCSNVAAMSFSGPAEVAALKAYAVTSSAFYWPFPFADGDPNNYVHDSQKVGQRDTFVIDEAKQVAMDYRAWAFTQEDNFCRLDIDRRARTLTVRTFDRDGDLIKGQETGRKLETVLDLAPWD
jgi:alkaline phosphatase D